MTVHALPVRTSAPAETSPPAQSLSDLLGTIRKLADINEAERSRMIHDAAVAFPKMTDLDMACREAHVVGELHARFAEVHSLLRIAQLRAELLDETIRELREERPL
jgi:hypothetical protein